MKILTKHKIVESYHFPFSEALSFSILLWTIWGLAESLYWQKLAPLFDSTAQRIDSIIYTEAFLLYLVMAVLFAFFLYFVIKLSIVALEHYEPYAFRGWTLSFILGFFFLMVLNYYLPDHLFKSGLSLQVQYGVAVVLVCFSLGLTILLWKWASGVDFRIRRSGTMMLSVLTLSLVLSFVPFPIFSYESGRSSSRVPSLGFTSARKLTAYYYLSALRTKNLYSNPESKVEKP